MSKLPIGLQVYGIRELLENSPEKFEEVMTEVKKIGYDGVELAGLYGLSPAYVRDILNKVGLIPISAHVAFAEMMNDLDEICDAYKTIGTKYLVMPYMAEECRPVHPEGFSKFLPLLSDVGKKIHEFGMTFLYHNHDFEFVKIGDEYGYDKMFDAIPKDFLQAELDTCWCDVATGLTEQFIRKYKNRIPIVHLKDYIKKGKVNNMYKLIGIDSEEEKEDDGYFGFRPIGFGQMIWEPILKTATEANAEWLIVEQDEHYEVPSLECARRSREYLRILGW